MENKLRSEAAREMGSAKTPEKQAAARANFEKAREALANDPAAIERKRAATSAAQKARWDRYRAEKAAQKQD